MGGIAFIRGVHQKGGGWNFLNVRCSEIASQVI